MRAGDLFNTRAGGLPGLVGASFIKHKLGAMPVCHTNRPKLRPGPYLAEMKGACKQTSCAAQISFSRVQCWAVAAVLSLP